MSRHHLRIILAALYITVIGAASLAGGVTSLAAWAVIGGVTMLTAYAMVAFWDQASHTVSPAVQAVRR